MAYLAYVVRKSAQVCGKLTFSATFSEFWALGIILWTMGAGWFINARVRNELYVKTNHQKHFA